LMALCSEWSLMALCSEWFLMALCRATLIDTNQ
jgi:hypothetical protein